MRASRASWRENAANSLYFTSKKKALQIRLNFFGVGVTIVCILQQLSAGAEPQRPLKQLGQKMLQIHCALQQK